MNKKDFFSAMNGEISITSIHKTDGIYQIVGKFCRITPDNNGTFDIWILNTKEPLRGLSKRKLNKIRHQIEKNLVKTPFIELTGEGWVKVTGTKNILQNRHLLGIRKARKQKTLKVTFHS